MTCNMSFGAESVTSTLLKLFTGYVEAFIANEDADDENGHTTTNLTNQWPIMSTTSKLKSLTKVQSNTDANSSSSSSDGTAVH